MQDSIDLLKLKANFSAEKWNAYLTRCVASGSVDELVKMNQRLQRGMTKLAKEKMNTQDMIDFFIRLSRSVENTLKQIWIQQSKNPNWNPLKAVKEATSDKRKENREFEKFLRKNSY